MCGIFYYIKKVENSNDSINLKQSLQEANYSQHRGRIIRKIYLQPIMHINYILCFTD